MAIRPEVGHTMPPRSRPVRSDAIWRTVFHRWPPARLPTRFNAYPPRAKAADTSGVPFFINARTDVFFQKPPDAHDTAMVDHALQRARAYADAGASGLFVPGLVADALIARLVESSPLPVNIMAMPGVPTAGAWRTRRRAVSHGPGPYRGAMQWLAAAARDAMA